MNEKREHRILMLMNYRRRQLYVYVSICLFWTSVLCVSIPVRAEELPENQNTSVLEEIQEKKGEITESVVNSDFSDEVTENNEDPENQESIGSEQKENQNALQESEEPEKQEEPKEPKEPEESKERKRSTLIERMKEYDYVVSSITFPHARLSETEVNQSTESGKRIIKGLSFAKYKEIMNYEWEDMTQYKKEPVEVTVDLTKRMTYSTYESKLKKLSRYDGVYLYKIGESVEGKNIYSVELDFPGDTEKQVIMLSGVVHSREQAGGMYLLKSMVDLVQEAQTSKKMQKMLKQYKFVIIPFVSADVSQDLMWEPWKRTTNKVLWKAAADGIDINRNFPSLMAGWQRYGQKRVRYMSYKPGTQFYGGAYLGENPETQAMMKWMYHYIAVEHAVAYLDLHQQGRIIYSGKAYCSNTQDKLNFSMAEKLCDYLDNYSAVKRGVRANEYNGGNGNTTDYAMSIALGKYSPTYGSYVFWDGEQEILPIDVISVSQTKKQGYHLKTINSKFLAFTIEIGSGPKYLGGSKEAYRYNNVEYTKHHFDTLLKDLPNMIQETLNP